MGTVGGWNDETCTGQGDGRGTDGCFCQYDGSGSKISNDFEKQQELDTALQCSKEFCEEELAQMLAGDIFELDESDERRVCSVCIYDRIFKLFLILSWN